MIRKFWFRLLISLIVGGVIVEMGIIILGYESLPPSLSLIVSLFIFTIYSLVLVIVDYYKAKK